MEEPTPTLGTIIRERRLALGLTQDELAEMISDESDYVRQSEISRIESGRVLLPRRSRLERIANALGFTLVDLLLISNWGDGDDDHSDMDGRVTSDMQQLIDDPSYVVRDRATPLRETDGASHDRDEITRLYEDNRRRFEKNAARFQVTRELYEESVGQKPSGPHS
jgi:transcriptional regulator with XRE-family HTH domain